MRLAYHNIGWTHFDAGDEAGARLLAKRLALRETMGNADRTRVAKWTAARGYRALGRPTTGSDPEGARRRIRRGREPDGYVYEELAEIALARGNADAARPWAAKAHAALKDDGYLAANESARLARLAAVAAGESPSQKP